MNEITKTEKQYVPNYREIERITCFWCSADIKELPQGETVLDHLIKQNHIYYCTNMKCDKFGVLTVGVVHHYKKDEQTQQPGSQGPTAANELPTKTD